MSKVSELQKLSNKPNLKGLEKVRGKKMFVETATQIIFEANSSFYLKERTRRKVQFLFFISFLLTSTKFSFWEEEWALAYNSMKF